MNYLPKNIAFDVRLLRGNLSAKVGDVVGLDQSKQASYTILFIYDSGDVKTEFRDREYVKIHVWHKLDWVKRFHLIRRKEPLEAVDGMVLQGVRGAKYRVHKNNLSLVGNVGIELKKKGIYNKWVRGECFLFTESEQQVTAPKGEV